MAAVAAQTREKQAPNMKSRTTLSADSAPSGDASGSEAVAEAAVAAAATTATKKKRTMLTKNVRDEVIQAAFEWMTSEKTRWDDRSDGSKLPTSVPPQCFYDELYGKLLASGVFKAEDSTTGDTLRTTTRLAWGLVSKDPQVLRDERPKKKAKKTAAAETYWPDALAQDSQIRPKIQTRTTLRNETNFSCQNI